MAARDYWCAPLVPLTSTDGPAVTAAALTDASPVPQKQIPGNLLEVGTAVRLRAQGEYTSTSATPTVVLGFYIGTIGSIGTAAVIAASAATALSATATAWPWEMDYEGEIRGLGTTGSIYGTGKLFLPASLTTYSAALAMPATAAARLVTISTVAYPQNLMIGCTLSSVTGAPSFTCRHVTMELLG